MRTIRVLLSALSIGVAISGLAVLVAGVPTSVACAVLLASSSLIPVVAAAYGLVSLPRDQVRSQISRPALGGEVWLLTGRPPRRELAFSAAG